MSTAVENVEQIRGWHNPETWNMVYGQHRKCFLHYHIVIQNVLGLQIVNLCLSLVYNPER